MTGARALGALALLLGGGLLTACSSDPAATALQDTAAHLGEVTSGTLDFELAVEGSDGRGRTGFALTGPFALAAPGGLPVADLVYAQTAGEASDDLRLIADGEAAWVEVEGTAYALPADRVEALRAPEGGSGDESPLGRLRLGEWITDGTATVDGETEHVTGRLDVPTLLTDLNALLASVGAGSAAPVPELSEAEAEGLRAATRSADLDLVTGAEDRLLRSLDAAIVLERDAALPGLPAGARFTLALALTDHNTDVSVTAPTDPQPFEALPTD